MPDRSSTKVQVFSLALVDRLWMRLALPVEVPYWSFLLVALLADLL
jgi:hypothetical protein